MATIISSLALPWRGWGGGGILTSKRLPRMPPMEVRLEQVPTENTCAMLA